MASIDLIAQSFVTAWTGSAYTGLIPVSRLYFDRAEKADGVAGFPYAEMFCKRIKYEVVTDHDGTNSLVTYQFKVVVWTTQGMTGGTSTGDQITDQGNIQRGLESVLNNITPNTAWNFVPGFLHCLPDDEMTIEKDQGLYQGRDVMKSTQTWTLLVSE